jgi:membrane dipeptidase
VPIPQFTLAPQVGRVPSSRVPLDTQQEVRFQRLMEDLLLIDVHQHPMVLAADATEMPAYFRGNAYEWGFEAVKAGGVDGGGDGQLAVVSGERARCLVQSV